MQEEKAKIFLSDDRGLNELDWFRSYNTFNFGRYFNEHKKAFGDLYVLNDDTLAGGKILQMMAEENTKLILIPVVGTVEYKDNNGTGGFVEAGQIQISIIAKGGKIEISNPFEADLVNFLQIWIKNKNENADTAPQLISFDLIAEKNKFIQLQDSHAKCSIGKYKGREKGFYQVSTPGKGIFIFIIEGAFEVQDRLLHARDGLALWNSTTIEFEALSNDAIILILEIPGSIKTQ